MQASPKVSVIIVTHNNSDLTFNCVEAVVENTKNCSYEIIVVDNGSVQNEAQKLVEASNCGFTLISLNRNLFFGEANNIAAEHANGECILFLNNDVRVTSGWLEQLVTTLEIEAFAGAVGPKFLYPNGTLQEAGAYIRSDGWTLQVGKYGVNFPPTYTDTTQVVDYCSAACLLLKRQSFLNIGGFDPIFDPAYFEDVDLALRLRSIGLFTYFCGQVAVYHEENRTSQQLWSNEQLRNHMVVNHKRFYGRWGDYLRRRLSEDCEPEPLSPLEWQPESRLNNRATAVLFCSSPIRSCENSRRLLLVASALEESHSVIIAADEIFSRCRVYSLCREFNIQLTSFQIRNISQIEACEGQIVIAFEGVPSNQCLGPHITFEHARCTLLERLEI
jgi:GT2 family glycosyltransferase